MYTKLVNSQKVLNLFANLSMRWEDEWRYEDFSEYTKAMAGSIKNIIGDISNIEGTMYPFGIKFTHNNKRWHLILKERDGYVMLAISSISSQDTPIIKMA